MFSYPTVHTQQSSVPNGVAEQRHRGARFTKLVGAFLGQRRGLQDPLAANLGQDAIGQPPGFSDAAGQPAVPSQPHEGSLGALPLPLRPRGYLRRHGAQHRHRPRGLPAPQLHCRLSHRARAQDAAEWCQHPLRRPCPVHLQGPGRTMTDLFIHLVAYQLVTLSGTGVSVLD